MINKNFSKLWLANAISTLGDGALLAAGPLLVASLTDNPVLISGAVFVQLAPWLLFSFITGVYVDRFDKRKILMIANILRAVAIGGLALAIGLDGASIPLIYTALFLLGVGDTLADGGAVTLLTNIVNKDQINVANSRLQATNTIGRQLAGPPLGAYLFVLAAALPFGLDAISFVIAALLIASIRVGTSVPSQTVERKSVIKEIKEGFAYLKQMPLLKNLTYLNFLVNITSMAIFATLVIYAKEQLGLSPLGYGLLLSTAAVGGVIGSFLSPALQKRFSNTTLLRGVLILEAVFNVSFVFVHSPWVAGVLYGLWSIVGVIWFITILSLRQQAVPSHLLGRVNGIYNFYRMGGLAVGGLVGGFWVSQFGVTGPFWIGGFVVGLLTIVYWRKLSVGTIRDLAKKTSL